MLAHRFHSNNILMFSGHNYRCLSVGKIQILGTYSGNALCKNTFSTPNSSGGKPPTVK